jgi:hypothetical protein
VTGGRAAAYLARALEEGVAVDRGAHAEGGEHREPLVGAALGLGKDRLATKDVREHIDARVEHLGRPKEALAYRNEWRRPERLAQPVVLPEGVPVAQQVLAHRALLGRRQGGEGRQHEELAHVVVLEPTHAHVIEQGEHWCGRVVGEKVDRLRGRNTLAWHRAGRGARVPRMTISGAHVSKMGSLASTALRLGLSSRCPPRAACARAIVATSARVLAGFACKAPHCTTPAECALPSKTSAPATWCSSDASAAK